MLQTRRLCLVWCSVHLISLCTVSGINLDISPSTVVLQSQSPTKTSFECNTISSDVTLIYKISLSMVSEFGDEQEFATAEPGGVKLSMDNAPASLKKSSANALGGIDSNTVAQSTLRVEFDTIQMACADAGTYKCAVVFSEPPYSRHSTRNLSVYALPSPLDLVATVDGTTRVGTLVSPLDMAINRTISFSCHGKIGSDTSNTIRWQITSRINEGQFNLHNPTPSTINDGTVSATPVDCSYSRTSTMTYVTTVEDSNRLAKLAFKCTTTVTPPGSQQYTTESEEFYIHVLGGSTGTDGDTGASGDDGGASSAGAIAGGVVGGVVAIVIIVLLVYFLWYRRRSTGDTYRTKEDSGPDNPNMAPSTDDLYVKPTKDKNRDGDDKGMDDDYNYRDADDYRGRSRGRHNQGMDNDSYNSRDGSPTMHMGSGHIGTGV